MERIRIYPSPPVLRTAQKRSFLERIFAADLDDDQALMATGLLALTGEDLQVSMSTFVATEMYACSVEVWRALIEALVQAGLVQAQWENSMRCHLAWVSDGRVVGFAADSFDHTESAAATYRL